MMDKMIYLFKGPQNNEFSKYYLEIRCKSPLILAYEKASKVFYGRQEILNIQQLHMRNCPGMGD